MNETTAVLDDSVATEKPPTPQPVWRLEPITVRQRRAPNRRRNVFVVAGSLAIILGCLLGLLDLLEPLPRPFYVPLYITEYVSLFMPPNAYAEADRDAIRDGGYFPNRDTETFASQERTSLLRQLDSLQRHPANEPLVVTLNAYACGSPGPHGIDLFPADADPSDPPSRLPLREVLRRLHNAPAKRKLLILDIMKPLATSRSTVLVDNVADRLPDEVKAAEDDYRTQTGREPCLLVLAACSPGQTAQVSETLKRSLFSYYLEEGLRGWADLYGLDGHPSRDGRIHVYELAEFIKARVDRHARLTSGIRQTPILLGSGPNFSLVALDHGRRRPQLPLPEMEPYPTWLKAGWEYRDACIANGTAMHSLLAMHQMQIVLMRAETIWRNSGPNLTEREKGDFDARFARVKALIEKNHKWVPRPVEPRTLAEARVMGQVPDPAVGVALNDLFTQLSNLQAQAEADAKLQAALPAERQKLTQAFLTKQKDKPPFDMAWAIIERLAAEERPSPDFVRLLNQMLTSLQPTPRYAETLFLGRLAYLADVLSPRGPSIPPMPMGDKDKPPQPPTPPVDHWPTDAVRLSIRAVLQCERLSARTEDFPWVRGLLGRGSQAMQEGLAQLFWIGFNDPRSVCESFEQSIQASEAGLAASDALQQARAVMHEAMSSLLYDRPHMERRPRAEPSRRILIQAVKQLMPLLVPPPLNQPALDAQQIADRAADWRHRSEEVRAFLDNHYPLFLPDNQQRLIARAAEQDAGPAVIADLDLLLCVPRAKADQRVALWTARAALAERLAKIVLQRDLDENTNGVTTPFNEPVEPNRSEGIAAENRRAIVRARVSLSLLDLLGYSPDRIQAIRTALSPSTGHPDWGAISDMLTRAWTEELPSLISRETDAMDHAWLESLFPSKRIAAQGGSGVDPFLVRRRESMMAAYSELAHRSLHIARQSPDRTAASFLGDSAAIYRRVAHPSPEVAVRLTGLERGVDLVNASSVAIPFQVSVSEVPAHVTTDVTVFYPAQSGVRAEVVEMERPATDVLDRQHFQLRVTRSQDRASLRNVPGVLVVVRVGYEPFFYRIPLRLPSTGEELELLLDRDPANPADLPSELRLRPIPGRQKYYVFVRNPSNRPRKASVQLFDGERALPQGEAAVVLPPNRTVKVSFGLPTVPMPMPMPMPPMPEAASAKPKAPEDLPAVIGPLTIKLTDTEKPDDAPIVQSIRLRVANPSEYVAVRQVKWSPVNPPAVSVNTLVASLRIRDRVAGPPVTAELVLPSSRIPGLRGIKAGTLKGVVPRDGSELRLYAENLELLNTASQEGQIALTLDGVERSALYRVTFARYGFPVTGRLDERPAVRIKIPRFVRSNPSQKFQVEVDNPPTDSRLIVSLESLLQPTEESDSDADRIKKFPTGRQERIGLTTVSLDGAIEFEAALRDWVAEFDTEVLTGRRFIRARLVDAQGRLIKEDVQPITLDDQPPENVAFRDPPLQAKKDAPLKLQAMAADTRSGIDTVQFYIGKAMPDGQPPKGAVPFSAKPSEQDASIWEATIPLDGSRKGPTDFLLVVTNKVGVSASDTATIELVDKLVTKTRIVGTVKQGDLGQPNIPVKLMGPNPMMKGKEMEIASGMTDVQGNFVFEDIAPGKYRVTAEKTGGASRKGEAAVTVKEGETATAIVNLTL